MTQRQRFYERGESVHRKKWEDNIMKFYLVECTKPLFQGETVRMIIMEMSNKVTFILVSPILLSGPVFPSHQIDSSSGRIPLFARKRKTQSPPSVIQMKKYLGEVASGSHFLPFIPFMNYFFYRATFLSFRLLL